MISTLPYTKKTEKIDCRIYNKKTMPKKPKTVPCIKCKKPCRKWNIKEQCGWCNKYICSTCSIIYDGYVFCCWKCIIEDSKEPFPQ